MVYNVVAGLEIDGNAIDNYYSLQIKQHFNQHHEFTVKLPHEVIEATEQFALSKVKNLIGKIIIIRLLEGEAQKVKNEFKGIITDVSIEQYDAYESVIILKGFSPTIILESGPHINSFLAENLKKIVQDSTVYAQGDCPLKLNTTYATAIPYLTQYKESHFDFINRLAGEYGEWFYYDGKSLVFGKPSSSKEIELIAGEDVTGIKLKLQLLPLDSKAFAYTYKDNTPISSKSPGSVPGLGEFGSFVSSEAKKMFSSDIISTGVRPKVNTPNELYVALKAGKFGAAAQLEMVTGTSTNPEVTLGATATISMSKRTGNSFDKQEHGKFVIIGVVHEIAEDGKYKNSFEGMPAGITIPPSPIIKRPVAEPQVAVVTDNNDPDKLGRVKVKMMWQENSATDWIRVLSPSAGSGGKTSKNRGFVFIPEVNDEVLVGFEYNDPDWPYVIGSLFHGKSAAGGGDKNSVKTLGTQSGHLITFNDDKKSLLIEDAKGNKIEFDGNGKMTLETSDSIEMKCGQSSMTLAKDGSITMKGAKISIEGQQEVGLKAPNVTVKADVGLKLEGVTVAAKGSAQISVEGAMAKLAGSGMTEITGAIVKIN